MAKVEKSELSMVIPFYNELGNAEKIIEEILKEHNGSGVKLHLVAVDNGSFDGTGKILDNLASQHTGIEVVHVPVNRGYGHGIIEGFKRAKSEYVGFMCADGQISAKDAVRTYLEIRDKDLDFVKIKRTKRHDGAKRKIMSKGYNAILRLFFGLKSDDVNATPKIMKKSLYDLLRLRSDDWFIDTEMMIKVRKKTEKIGEVDAEFRKRECGKSNVGVFIVFEFLNNLIRTRL